MRQRGLSPMAYYILGYKLYPRFTALRNIKGAKGRMAYKARKGCAL